MTLAQGLVKILWKEDLELGSQVVREDLGG